MILRGARIVTEDGVLDDGALVVEGTVIRAVHPDARSAAVAGPDTVGYDSQAFDLGGGWLVPGFVDLHCHGGSGHDMASGAAAEIRAAADFHTRHGTTTMLASLASCARAGLLEHLRVAAEVAVAGSCAVRGVHLEGPFLAPGRCGAQPAEHLRAPDRDELSRLIDAAAPITMLTVAPELPGALGLIEDWVAAGLLVAVGHTDAGYDEAREGFRRGATVATHLFNAMPPLHHREPGAALAALDSEAVCELINDGVHLHPRMAAVVARLGSDRLALVTDAISATGLEDGDYTFAGQPISVHDRQPRLKNGVLAGSVLTMDEAFRRAVTESGLSLRAASRAASGTPARALGLRAELGAIAAGLAADLVQLDDGLRVRRVMRAGRWVAG